MGDMSEIIAPYIYHSRNKADDQVYRTTFLSPHPSEYTAVFYLSARYRRPADAVYPAMFFFLQVKNCCIVLRGAENPNAGNGAFDGQQAIDGRLSSNRLAYEVQLQEAYWTSIMERWVAADPTKLFCRREDLPSPIVASHWWALFPIGHDLSPP